MAILGYILVSLFILLGGCTQITTDVSTVESHLSSVLTKAGAFSIADLKAADADAKAHSDTVASMCYEAVIPLIEKVQATPLTAPVGLVSAFQDLRDAKGLSNSSQTLLKQLEIPCGPLAADVNMDLVRLISKFAGAAVPGLGALLP